MSSEVCVYLVIGMLISAFFRLLTWKSFSEYSLWRMILMFFIDSALWPIVVLGFLAHWSNS